jgi:hypothetical protein
MWFQHNRAGQAEDSQLGNLSGRIRKEDNAHAMLDRVTHITSDLESAKVKARSLFDTLNIRTPMAYGFWTKVGMRCCFGHPALLIPRPGLFFND